MAWQLEIWHVHCDRQREHQDTMITSNTCLSWCFATWKIWQDVYSTNSWHFHFSSSSLKGLSQKFVRSLVLIEINSEKCKSRLGYLVQLGGKPFVSLLVSQAWNFQFSGICKKCFVFLVETVIYKEGSFTT